MYSMEDAASRQEIIDFADMVFSMSAGSTDFEGLLPKAYDMSAEDTVMHHVIRENGAIRALVDVYPLTLRTAQKSLRCAYIGTVSVHPKARRKGYMIELMEKAEASLRKQGYDLILLDGSRQRYQHFGFEKAGIKYCFNITADSIRHALAGVRCPDIELVPVESGQDDLLATMYAIYSKRHLRARSAERFYTTLKSWNADIYGVLHEGRCVGYLDVSADETAIYEAELTDTGLLAAVISRYMELTAADELAINVGADETDKLEVLDGISDYYALSMSHQLKLLEYARVLEFLLCWKRQYTPLAEGSFVIEADGKKLEISVTDADVTVTETVKPAQASFDGVSLVKTLTTSYYYIEIQRSGSALQDAPQGWFPLPFFLPEADTF